MAIDISTSSRRVGYTGNGATTAFAVNFAFYADTDLTVYVNSVLKTLTTDYTVSGAGSESGGTVTFLAAPTNGHSVVIFGNSPIERTTHFPVAGRFNTETLNEQLNKLIIIDQQLANKVSRTIRLADSDPGTGLELPDAATRASKFLGFDGSGNPIAAAGTSANLGPVSTFINTLLDDVDAATARSTLGAATSSAATTTATGLVELATQAEFDTGTDSTRAVTTDILHGATPATVTMDTANDKAWIKDATDGKLKLALIPAGASGEVNTVTNVGSGSQWAKTKSGVDIPMRTFIAVHSQSTVGTDTGNGWYSQITGFAITTNTNDLTLTLSSNKVWFAAAPGGGS